MATRGAVLERQIMSAVPRNPNPNLGFRGNPDGVQGTKLVDYGVYAAPIHRALLRFGYSSDVLAYAADRDLRSYLDRGWPVVTWVTYNLQRATPQLAWWAGTQFFLVPHEHAVLVVGYDGRGLIANDPWTATRVRYGWQNFNRAWGYFGNMALAIQPCPVPQPVSRLRMEAVGPTAATWTWKPSPNAARYQVQIDMEGDSTQVVLNIVQTAHRVTVPSPVPGAVYRVSVRAVATCGSLSPLRRLWNQMPSPLPTPVGTPPEVTVVPATPGATSGPSPSPGTPRPAATGSPTIMSTPTAG